MKRGEAYFEKEEYAEAIVIALNGNKGNQTKAARHLGIARTTLSAKIRKYQIDLTQWK
jgi:DNA-binding protein Fis